MAKGIGSKTDIKWLVGVIFLVFFATAVLPTIAVQVKSITGDTTNFSAGEIALYSLIGVVLAIAIVYKLLKGSELA